jgi:hypothetical protein
MRGREVRCEGPSRVCRLVDELFVRLVGCGELTRGLGPGCGCCPRPQHRLADEQRVGLRILRRVVGLERQAAACCGWWVGHLKMALK